MQMGGTRGLESKKMTKESVFETQGGDRLEVNDATGAIEDAHLKFHGLVDFGLVHTMRMIAQYRSRDVLKLRGELTVQMVLGLSLLQEYGKEQVHGRCTMIPPRAKMLTLFTDQRKRAIRNKVVVKRKLKG
ncbi:hypothetical protein Tco_1057620 [Tanacetum coccineum]|uniref:Uncharacterized protein n=1 Tax=Tanacetum coccineum TaxID=301880 RepID=A0ABQ5H6H1_9ASTR